MIGHDSTSLPATTLVALLTLALLGLGGCISANTGGAAAVPTDGLGAGDGGNGGGGDAGTDGAGNGATPGDGTDGSEGEGEPGDEDGTGGDGGDADDEEPDSGVSPPTVTLSVSDTSPAAGAIIFLTCSVSDDGGGFVSEFSFSSTAGAETIVHDGVSSTASAFVPAALFTVTYTCSGTNEAGQGPSSNPVTVSVID
ncbi:MAG: hypothetical protein ACYSUQ_14215 [Planctomycetota bacterium]|jgi:hypothetical protein